MTGNDDHPYGRMSMLYGVVEQFYRLHPGCPTFRGFLEVCSYDEGQMGADARELLEELCIGCKTNIAEIKGSYCYGCIKAADPIERISR